MNIRHWWLWIVGIAIGIAAFWTTHGPTWLWASMVIGGVLCSTTFAAINIRRLRRESRSR